MGVRWCLFEWSQGLLPCVCDLGRHPSVSVPVDVRVLGYPGGTGVLCVRDPADIGVTEVVHIGQRVGMGLLVCVS